MLGMMPYYVNETVCGIDIEDFESGLSVASDIPRYSPRDSEGIHYYVGTKGIKSWEFNAVECYANITDICGCLKTNNAFEYLAENDGEKCIDD
jgi:hypothetical protein